MKYNLGFAALYMWFQLTLQLREEDIQNRRQQKIVLTQVR